MGDKVMSKTSLLSMIAGITALIALPVASQAAHHEEAEAPAPAEEADVDTAMMGVLRAQQDAWNAGDIEQFMEFEIFLLHFSPDRENVFCTRFDCKLDRKVCVTPTIKNADKPNATINSSRTQLSTLTHLVARHNQ